MPPVFSTRSSPQVMRMINSLHKGRVNHCRWGWSSEAKAIALQAHSFNGFLGIWHTCHSSLITFVLTSSHRWCRRFDHIIHGRWHAENIPHSSAMLRAVEYSCKLRVVIFGPTIGPAMAIAGDVSIMRCEKNRLHYIYLQFHIVNWKISFYSSHPLSL